GEGKEHTEAGGCRVKSNTAIKGSDRRKLRADVAAAFPTLGTDQVSALVPGKEELNIVKLYAHSGDAVTAYVCGGNPILFELEKNLYPTDLMLPGLVVPPAGLPQVQKGDLCAIALVGNRYCASPLCLWGKTLEEVMRTHSRMEATYSSQEEKSLQKLTMLAS
ncbi:eukaryotic translation initiation factor 2D-like, partial [Lontra canadensis]|uniref:eukaryotic translation initiation factor 2D-like n=1 Tax=Lontra canadensis TaxID=76717 RepID=UPI0013F371B4